MVSSSDSYFGASGVTKYSEHGRGTFRRGPETATANTINGGEALRRHLVHDNPAWSIAGRLTTVAEEPQIG